MGTTTDLTCTDLAPGRSDFELHAANGSEHRRRAHWPLVPLALLLNLLVGGSIRTSGPATIGALEALPLIRLTVSVDDDPAFGPVNAPVTIIEFGDFLCPYCARFHQQTLPALLATYPDKIRFVYRDFPVLGAASGRAAQAAACAGEQGRYWDYHGALFGGLGGSDEESLLQLARGLGLDQGLLKACLVSGRYAGEVQQDLAAGLALRINGTPMFFINGRPHAGAQPLAAFQQLVDDELARK